MRDLNTWYLIVIYIGYQSTIDSLQRDVKLISKFDYERASTPVGPNGPYYQVKFLDDMVYDGWMSFQFTFMYKRAFR